MFDIFWYDYSDGDIEKLIASAKLESKTEYFWLANKNVDYTNFDFRYFPNRHQTKYYHAWPSHNNERHYTTWLIPVDSNSDCEIVWHNEVILKSKTKHYDVCCIDTKTHELHEHDFSVNLITTMQDAIDLAVKKTNKPWLWIVCDICDYTNFDFNWLPSNHQMDYIHCWPSGTCEKGDTFLINTISYKQNKREFDFNHIPVPRKEWPLTWYDNDTLCLLMETPSEIYNLWLPVGSQIPQNYPDICIWEKRPIVSLNKSNCISLIPRDYIFNGGELYQYPHLLRYPQVAPDKPCDIIMISNGESCADKNYERLCQVLLYNPLHLSGIDGRLRAYRAAAEYSKTPWFIAVFAKCYVKDEFANLNWYPDYWQQPKHYIFNNHNLDNGLVYGHMAPIAYNVKLMLENSGGLDMTLAQEHAVVPITLSETTLLDDPWLSWRTAFREVVKIIHYNQKNYTIESEHRLHVWKNSKDLWQRRGAEDAEVYYTYGSNGGDENTIIETNEWSWLKEYFNSRYSEEIIV